MTDELLQLTVKNALVKLIRAEIIRGSFLPGERLRLRDVADQFKVSTQPVREALSELEAEGLVQSEPRKGYLVTRLSVAELRDIYDIRATLESMAARLAVPFLNATILAEMERAIADMDRDTGDVVKLVQRNFEFHMTLYTASGRRHLYELNATLRHRTEHYLHSYMIDLGGMPIAQEEHRAIVEACRRADADAAANLTYKHVASVGAAIIENIERRHAKSNKDE